MVIVICEMSSRRYDKGYQIRAQKYDKYREGRGGSEGVIFESFIWGAQILKVSRRLVRFRYHQKFVSKIGREKKFRIFRLSFRGEARQIYNRKLG